MLMKTTRFLLFLFISFYTFNTWAKSEIREPFSITSENAVPVDLTIYVNGGMPGILFLYINNQPLYQGYWGDGYMLYGNSQIEFKPQIDVYPGDIIEVYAYLHLEGGNSGTIYVQVPDTKSPSLYVTLTKFGNYKISASF